MASFALERYGAGLDVGEGTATACALDPDPMIGMRAGPWLVVLEAQSATVQKKHMAAYITVDGNSVANLPCAAWPTQDVTGATPRFGVVIMVMETVVVVFVNSIRQTFEVHDTQAVRSALRGVSRLSLVVSGLNIAETPRALHPKEPESVLINQNWMGNTPYVWQRNSVSASIKSIREMVVIAIESTTSSADTQEGMEAVVRTMRDIIDACRHFLAYGMSPHTPVLQLEGFIELTTVARRLGSLVESLRVVPQYDPPILTTTQGLWWNRGGTTLTNTPRGPSTGPVTGIVPLRISEVLALPWQRPPSLQVWAYVVCSLGDVVGKNRGKLIGMVAKVGK